MNTNREIIKVLSFRISVLFIIVVLMSSCAKKPRYILELPSEATPEIVYCFDTVGHKPGAKPWILGGTCCCTPSEEVLADYMAHGHVAEDMTLEDLIALYEEKGIKTALDHGGCNNMCLWGPHVVKGGKCMVPPTPMTQNYEEVFSGEFPELDEKELKILAEKREKRIKKYMKQRGKQ